MGDTKRILADVPAEVAIDFKIAVLKSGKKVPEAVAEALQAWTKQQEMEEIQKAEAQAAVLKLKEE